MIRWKKPKEKTCKCPNCLYYIQVHPETVKETMFPDFSSETIIATYIECPVCGERILKQLDTIYTRSEATKGVKLEMLQRNGKKLSSSQKKKLKDINRMLSNKRTNLNKKFWDEIYQSLNQEEKTEIVDQELIPGDEVTSTEEAGERMNEHGRRTEQQ